jgi:hypothetical protein
MSYNPSLSATNNNGMALLTGRYSTTNGTPTVKFPSGTPWVTVGGTTVSFTGAIMMRGNTASTTACVARMQASDAITNYWEQLGMINTSSSASGSGRVKSDDEFCIYRAASSTFAIQIGSQSPNYSAALTATTARFPIFRFTL